MAVAIDSGLLCCVWLSTLAPGGLALLLHFPGMPPCRKCVAILKGFCWQLFVLKCFSSAVSVVNVLAVLGVLSCAWVICVQTSRAQRSYTNDDVAWAARTVQARVAHAASDLKL